VIAIDQDALGKPAEPVRDAQHGTTTGNNEVWMRSLADGTLAVGLFNRQSYPRPITVAWADLNRTGPQNVRDLWQRKDLGAIAEKYTVTVPPHGVVLLKVGK
jgi:alpha-galactosidase